MYARISAALVAVALVMTGLASAQERFGTLTGRVTDQQGAAVPGVTVTVTNIADRRKQGLRHRRQRPVRRARSESRTLQRGVRTRGFLAGRTGGYQRHARTRASSSTRRCASAQLTETVQVTAEAAPLVDTRSTLISHNVTAEEFDRLPKGRSFQSIALTAPSVNPGEVEGGFQVNGASGAENAFTVDGIVTNSLINGQSRQNTVFEYLQEVQVKTSGISAEYGGALGGVVSAVTKSGGNVFRGEGHYFFEGSALSAGPVERLVLDPIGDRTAFFVQDAGIAGATTTSSADRLADRSSATSCSSSDRISPRNEKKTNHLQLRRRQPARSSAASGGSRRSAS